MDHSLCLLRICSGLTGKGFVELKETVKRPFFCAVFSSANLSLGHGGDL